MARRNNSLLMAVAAVAGFGIFSCTTIPFLVPNPYPYKKKETAVPEEQAKPQENRKGVQAPAPSEPNAPAGPSSAKKEDEVDFSLAFNEAPAATGKTGKTIAPSSGSDKYTLQPSSAYAPINVPRKMIRILLRQELSEAVLYAMDTLEVHASGMKNGGRFRGRLAVKMRGTGRISAASSAGGSFETVLPCTLVATSGLSLIDIGLETYRGSLIIDGDRKFSLINYCDVEDYLRGVLPLEMGKRRHEEFEAYKAQAVSARTYAYKQIVAHLTGLYDVVSTVADQVYGGADVELVDANHAVEATRDLVMTWHDSLADAYYHSTCGGRTANIEDVWDRPPCDYLMSIKDIDADGKAYCSFSPFFTWEEEWSGNQLSAIVRAAESRLFFAGKFGGQLQSIMVTGRFRCGRIRKCELQGSDGSAECGGDKVRFVLRCRSASGEILRSSSFSVVKNGPDLFTLRGRGYGHGVGMCQMGAVGRARAGQGFEKILQAYFSGTEVRKALIK